MSCRASWVCVDGVFTCVLCLLEEGWGQTSNNNLNQTVSFLFFLVEPVLVILLQYSTVLQMVQHDWKPQRSSVGSVLSAAWCHTRSGIWHCPLSSPQWLLPRLLHLAPLFTDLFITRSSHLPVDCGTSIFVLVPDNVKMKQAPDVRKGSCLSWILFPESLRIKESKSREVPRCLVTVICSIFRLPYIQYPSDTGAFLTWLPNSSFSPTVDVTLILPVSSQGDLNWNRKRCFLAERYCFG